MEPIGGNGLEDVLLTGLDDGGLDPGPGVRWAFPDIGFTDAGELSFSLGNIVVVDIESPVLVPRIKDNSLEIVTDDLLIGEDTQIFVEETLYLISADEFEDLENAIIQGNGEITSQDFDAFLGANEIGRKNVFIDELNDPASFSLFDELDFAPEGALVVQTSFTFTAATDDDSVRGFVLDQRFSRILEPATLAIFGGGLAGLVWVRRRQQAKRAT